MTETFTRWDVTDQLRAPEDMRLYLEACAEEDPGDGSLIRAALNDIARAGNMSRLAREIGISREGLYKALSEDGNPTFATVMRITRALGLQWRITDTRIRQGEVDPSGLSVRRVLAQGALQRVGSG